MSPQTPAKNAKIIAGCKFSARCSAVYPTNKNTDFKSSSYYITAIYGNSKPNVVKRARHIRIALN
jgi:hypothetical protein